MTGGGNYFHYLWEHADVMGLGKEFLSWDKHPDRDEDWYDKSPEMQDARPWERAEQYPANPSEAFVFSQAVFFDGDALLDYAQRTEEPVFRGEFVEQSHREAKLVKKEKGWISVWKFPDEGHAYAVGVDTATGRGLDFSCAYVVDLASNTDRRGVPRQAGRGPVRCPASFPGPLVPDGACGGGVGGWVR